MSTETWTDSDDWRTLTHTRTTPHGVFRAVVRLDEYPEPPYDDGSCPVYAYESTGYGYRLEDSPRMGGESDRASGVDFPLALDHFHERSKHWRDTLEQLDRWLRVFHGGGVREISSTVWQGDPYFLTYDTRAMRESWGLADDAPPRPAAVEWQAYIDGDAHVVSIERACEFDEDGDPSAWETVDGPVGGYYGHEYAKEAALEMLGDEVERTGAAMLPLGATA